MNSTSNPLGGMVPFNSHPLPYKRQACIHCHDAKVRCVFLDSLTKCDKCLKQNRECVPHVSMQGKRPKGGKKKETKKQEEKKVKGVAPSNASLQSSAGQKPGVRVQNQVAPDHSASNSHDSFQSVYVGNIASQPIFMQQSHFANAIIQSAVNHNRNHVPTQTAYGTSATYKTDQSSIKVHDTSKTTLEEKNVFDVIGANVFKNEDHKRSSCSWNWNCDNVAYLNCQQSDNASAARMVDAPQPVTAPYLTTEDHAQYKYEISQSIDHEECSLPLVLSLERWVKHATRVTCGKNQGSRPYADSDYLNASVKIAISLATTVNNTSIDLLPICSSADWIASTVVKLKPKAQDNGDNDLLEKDETLGTFLSSCQPPASPRDGSVASSWNDFGLSLDLNEDMESFSSEFQEQPRSDIAGDDGSIQFGFGFGHDRSDKAINERIETFLEAKDKKTESTVSVHPGPHALAIDSAEICWRENGIERTGHKDAVNPSAQGIFHLATVFYFLFTGGELPPNKLKALASSPGAFVALPTQTLIEPSDEEQVKRCHGVSGSSLCKVNCEYLCTIGVPAALCSVILNMLECVHGDLGGKETYSRVTDIISDLQLMLDKPEVYLFGPNMNTLSMAGLQLNELTISRKEEFECIISCYNRCTEKTELAIIEGEMGAGKSHLSRQVSEYVGRKGGICLTTKFDQTRQLVPFQALSSAFDQFLDILIQKESEADWAKWVINRLQVALGRDACYLLPLIPKLIKVLDVDMTHIDPRDQDPNNAMRRLQNLLCQFVDTVSKSSKVPVLFVCDDMQWADEASIALIYQMLRREHKSLCFLVCRRISTRHEPIWWMIDNATAAGINTTTVKLHRIERDALRGYLSDLMCLSPRIIRPLSDIVYKRTKGNLLYLQQLLLSLSREGLLRLDLRMKRWVWDEVKILSTKLPDNVALCFTGAIGNLPVDVQLALHTLSMFGASTVKADYVKFLESKLNLNLQSPLKMAETEGLINHTNGYYTFCHDMIQETCHKMIAEHDRRSNHLIYGRCFISHHLDADADDYLFAAVGQINFGGVGAISVPQEYVLFATYNLTAAKKAMQMNDFTFAHSLLIQAITFLQQNHWLQHYQLSLEIFQLACKCAFAIGDLDSLRDFSEQIFMNAMSFDDTLEVQFIVISSLISSNIGEALKRCTEILLQLGICVPSNISQEELANETEQTIRFALGITPELLLNYKIMTDQKMLVTQKFLSLLLLVTHHKKPELYHYLILKMIKMVLSHGLSEHAPAVFVCFGSYLAMAKNGYPELGHRYVNIAKALLHKLDVRLRSGEVLLIVAHVKCCLEPLGAATELYVEGEKEAISAGDVNSSCFHRLGYVNALFWSGAHLQNVHDKISLACEFLKEQEHKNALIFITMTQRTVMTLRGRESEAVAAGGLGDENSVRHFQNFHFNHMFLSLLFAKSDLNKCCSDYFEHESNSSVIVFSDIIRGFIAGLASFRVYRETKDIIWMSRGAKRREDLLFWATKGCKWNFDHKLSILLAEESFSLGDFDTAKGHYTRAIAAADQSRFINDSAIACELAGRFYFETGDLNLSLEHFRMAHEKYKMWGALGKTRHLESILLTTFGQEALSI